MTEQKDSDVGGRLRALRQERGLSVRGLAELCELSPNTISLIERERTSPTVSTLQRLATALGVPITSFFSPQAERTKVLYTRHDQRIRSGSASVTLESLGYGLEEQACDPFWVSLKPGASSGRQVMVHQGHELIYCLQGTLDYEIAGEHFCLAPGDSLFFHADLPHRWSNLSQEPAVFLMILQASDELQDSLNQHLHP